MENFRKIDNDNDVFLGIYDLHLVMSIILPFLRERKEIIHKLSY